MLSTIFIVFFLSTGVFFFAVGTVGLLRLPDPFSRMHATTKCDTLGEGLILLALIVYFGPTLVSVKLLLIIVFIWLTNPTAAHIIARASYHNAEAESTSPPPITEPED